MRERKELIGVLAAVLNAATKAEPGPVKDGALLKALQAFASLLHGAGYTREQISGELMRLGTIGMLESLGLMDASSPIDPSDFPTTDDKVN